VRVIPTTEHPARTNPTRDSALSAVAGNGLQWTVTDGTLTITSKYPHPSPHPKSAIGYALQNRV